MYGCHTTVFVSTCFPPQLSSSCIRSPAVAAEAIFSWGGRKQWMRPQHLKDLTGPSAQEGGQLLLASLMSLTNLLLNSQIPSLICLPISGLFLTALEKKGGGFRPIAVRCTLHHIVTKVACSTMRLDIYVCSPCFLSAWVWNERRNWSSNPCCQTLCSSSPSRLCSGKAWF